MRINASLKIGVTGLVLAGAAISAGGVAYADYAPSAGDVVGVSGDTPQYALLFLADGDFSGHAGFNSAGAYNRLVSFNATADANARQAYIDNTPGRTSTALLNPTDVLRAGELAPDDLTVWRAGMPLIGEDPFGQDFLDRYGEWRAKGSPAHSMPSVRSADRVS